MENTAYAQRTVVDVDVAVVGIGRSTWVSADPTEDMDIVHSRMATHRFDVLPIDVPHQRVEEFYASERWGDYESIVRRQIRSDILISYRTPVRECIRMMTRGTERPFYFLVKENEEVTGLITIANLNCVQARAYVYALLAELEAEFARLVQTCVKSADDPLDEESVVRRSPDAAYGLYMKERALGLDRHLVEYLTLSNLAAVLKEGDAFQLLGASSKKQLDEMLKPVIQVRNRVAHPVRSLIEHPDCVDQLWSAITTAEVLLDRLQAFRS